MKKRVEHIREIAEILGGYYEHKPRKAAFVVLAEDDEDLLLSRLFCGDKETLIEGVCENLSDALIAEETDLEVMRRKMYAFIRGLRKAVYTKWEKQTGEKVPFATLDEMPGAAIIKAIKEQMKEGDENHVAYDD